jgi:hypothetical protein
MSRKNRQDLPLVKCTPWCEHGDGHPGEMSVEDQWCSSEQLEVGLTLETVLGDAREPSSLTLDYVSTYLSKDALHAPPHVHLGRNCGTGVKLTLDEARQLGEALVDLARLGEK